MFVFYSNNTANPTTSTIDIAETSCKLQPQHWLISHLPKQCIPINITKSFHHEPDTTTIGVVMGTIEFEAYVILHILTALIQVVQGIYIQIPVVFVSMMALLLKT